MLTLYLLPENESEVSLFNRDLYEKFLADPETKWL